MYNPFNDQLEYDKLVFVNGIPRRISEYITPTAFECVTIGPIVFEFSIPVDELVLTLWQRIKRWVWN